MGQTVRHWLEADGSRRLLVFGAFEVDALREIDGRGPYATLGRLRAGSLTLARYDRILTAPGPIAQPAADRAFSPAPLTPK